MFIEFILLFILIIVYLGTLVIKPKNYPPGPPWLPFFGCVRILKRLTLKYGSQNMAAQDLANQYSTRVLGTKLVHTRYVFVFTDELIRKVLTSEHYEGRPKDFFMRLRSMGTLRGITGVDGPLWQEHRQFAMRHLRNVGFGKPIMEEYIVEELHQLLKTCNEEGKNVYLNSKLSPHVINVLWMFTAGRRIDKDDIRLPKLLTLLTERSKAFDMAGGWLNLFPYLRFVAPKKTGYNLLKKLNSELHDFFQEVINEHRKQVSVADEDLIHTFLCEMKAKENDENNTFTDDQLIMVILDLFIAGSQTTSNTLDFAFLIMLTRPDIQSEVHAELDKVLMSRTPCLEDKHALPYTMAVLHEIQRYFNIVPLTGPRRVVQDTELDGYTIPKNTIVLISLFSVHMDPKIWGDPEVFRPERFLDAQGKLNEALLDRLIPFGLGRRRCLGEALARGCIFLFFTGVMQRFKIQSTNGVVPQVKPVTGLTTTPPVYRSSILPRIECL